MEVRADYLSKILLNLAQTSGEGLNLTKGEVLKGVIEGLAENGLVLVNLKGLSVEARTDINVYPDQELFLLVEEFRGSTTYLKVVSPQMINDWQDQRIMAGLKQIGVKPDETMVIAARKLIQHNLPVTRDNMETVIKGARELGGINSRHIELAALALSGGLKADARTLPILREFLAGPVMIREVLQEALHFLEAEEATSQKAAPRDQIPGRELSPGTIKTSQEQPVLVVAPQPETSKGDLPFVSRPVNTEAEVKSSPLPEMEREKAGSAKPGGNQGVETPAAPGTNQARDTLEQGGHRQWGTNLSSTVGETILNRPAALPDKMANLLRLLLPLVSLQGENPEEILSQLKHAFQGPKEVIKALTLLEDILLKDPEIIRPTASQTLLGQIQLAEREVLGQAIFNSLERGSYDNQLNYYYFALPLTVNGRENMVELKIFKDGKNRRRLDEMNEIKIAVSLNTQNLGLVVFHLVWKKDEGLTLQGAVENSETRTLIESNLGSLIKSLEDLGHGVRFTGIKVVNLGERLRPGLKEVEPDVPQLLGIDITV